MDQISGDWMTSGMLKSSQESAWGTDAMRHQLRTRFMHYARTFQGKRGLKRFSNASSQTPNLYVYFAGRSAGYVHEWRLSGSDLILGHFAVDKALEGKGFGESLLRGFVCSAQRELGIKRVVFRLRKHSPAYTKLLLKVGAIDTGRVVDFNPEWHRMLPALERRCFFWRWVKHLRSRFSE